MSEQPNRSRGRPVGSGTGPSKPVLDQLRRVINACMNEGIQIKEAARRELGETGQARYEQYARRYKNDVYMLQEEAC